MGLFQRMAEHGPRTGRRSVFRPELLEGRNLLSTASVGLPPLAEIQSATQVVPMQGTIQGEATIGAPAIDQLTHLPYVPVTITGTGNVSHLGRVTVNTTHRVEVILSPTGGVIGSLTLDGQATITAANGDTLTLKYSGTGVPTANGFDDTFSYLITGGTGRFAGATGSGVIHSTDLPSDNPTQVPFILDLDGVVSTVGSNKKK